MFHLKKTRRLKKKKKSCAKKRKEYKAWPLLGPKGDTVRYCVIESEYASTT